MKVKSLSDVVAKWGDVTPGRSSYYEKGAVGAGADWEKNTIAAAPVFKAAISAGNIDKLFAGGVKKAGGAKFDRKVKDVGVGRFGSGVSAAIGDFSAGVSPYLDALAALPLGARGPRGADINIERVRLIAKTLATKRLAIKGA